MPKVSKQPRMRGIRAVIALSVAASALVAGQIPARACPLLQDCTSTPQQANQPPKTERWLLNAINVARSNHGRAPVRWDASLDAMATAHAKRMAAAAQTFHNGAGLRERRAQTGETLGENVGVGPDLDDVHRAFLASASHRQTLLGPFERVGLGVVRKRSGEVYVVEVFASDRGYGSAPSRPATAAPAQPDRRRVASVKRDGEPFLVGERRSPRPAAPVLAAQAHPGGPGPLPWSRVGLGVLVLAATQLRRYRRWLRGRA